MSTLCTAFKPGTDPQEPCEDAAAGRMKINGKVAGGPICMSHYDSLRVILEKVETSGVTYTNTIELEPLEAVWVAEPDPLDVIPVPVQKFLIELDRKLEETDLTQVAPEGMPSSKVLTEAAVAYVKAYRATGSTIDDYMSAMRRYAEGKGLQPRAVKGILNVARAGLQRRVKQRMADGGKVMHPAVQPGRYAVVDTEDDTLKFYRVRINKPTTGQWAGRTFIDVFVYASDEEHRLQVKETRDRILGLIGKDPQAAAQKYTDELGKCSECGRTLTDEYSRSVGRGPICDGKFNAKRPW